MGFGDVVQRMDSSDVDVEVAARRQPGEFSRRCLLCVGREVVAAEQAESRVCEQQRPEGDARARVTCRVGGDDPVGRDHRGVEIGIG